MENNAYQAMNERGLRDAYAAVRGQYDALREKNLSLDMSRGKPGLEQLNLSAGLLTALTDPADCVSDGIEVRNYGFLSGIPAAKQLFAEILGCRPDECFIGGSSSLTLMYDLVSKAFTHGLLHSKQPWCRLEKVKWLCPVPGYDRHFRITQSFGCEMINVPMTPEGPDMDLVEALIRDPEVKGMWCVPKYSNPDGIIYSESTCKRLARMKPAAEDFALVWDNAYCVHEFDGPFVPFPDIIGLCRDAGNADMVYEFASTSKITLPGAGISVMAASVDNQTYLQRLMGVQMISEDKVNQLRHVRFLKNKENVLALMQRHAEFLRPRFACVLGALETEIAPLGLASWQRPKGGYFVSVNTQPGLARRTLALCKEAGVAMTPAGAAFPRGIDPNDSNIRIAPSLPPVQELAQAMEIFCASLKLAALEKLLGIKPE